MKRALGSLLLLLLVTHARPAGAADGAGYAWDQHPGAQLPMAAPLRDEAGAATTLGQIVHGLPTLLVLGYFRCPGLCGVVRADLFHALDATPLQAGRDYTFVAVSIDPAEGAPDAAHAKAADLAAAGRSDGRDWHYLTASSDVIAAIARAVGFRSQFQERWRQFLHPTGVVVLGSGGSVSSYLMGVGFSGGDLQAAVVRARDGLAARAGLPVLLLCFHYDPATGRYDLEVMKLLRLFGILTVATLAGVFVVLNRHPRSRA